MELPAVSVPGGLVLHNTRVFYQPQSWVTRYLRGSPGQYRRLFIMLRSKP